MDNKINRYLDEIQDSVNKINDELDAIMYLIDKVRDEQEDIEEEIKSNYKKISLNEMYDVNERDFH